MSYATDREDTLRTARGPRVLAAAATTVVAAVGAALALATPAAAAPATTRLSSTATGAPANDFSELPGLSDDGRYATFTSNATNLAPQDPGNFSTDVYVRDRVTGAVERVSVNSQGEEGIGTSGGFLTAAPVTPDGRFVAFDAFAFNLVPGDTNRATDAFLRDRRAGTTTRVSVSSAGAQADGASSVDAISADGRYVLFGSRATNLVPGDTNGAADAFIRDTQAGTTTRVSVKRDGTPVDKDTRAWDLSNDGRYVAFTSLASYTGGDRNRDEDAYVKDLRTGSIERVSVTNSGRDFPGGTMFGRVSMSADGRYVSFNAAPANLLPQIYVRDRVTKTTTLVSVNLKGRPATRASFGASISPNGRFVAFNTAAENMVTPEPTAFAHVYVRDLRTGRTTLASVTSGGAPIPQSTGEIFMCDAGVAFNSFYPGVVPDGNDKEQVYFRSL
jgi:Tol biopolymer transport system component